MVTELHQTLLIAQGAEPTSPAAASRARPATPIITPAGANGGATPAPLPAVPAADGVVALARGKSYHLAGCTMVAGKQVEQVDAATVDERGLAPCPLCDPAPALAAAR
jgi:hypothetical protein